MSARARPRSAHRTWHREGSALVCGAARKIDPTDGRLTSDLIEPIRRTFHGMHLLAHLKREELAAKGKEDASRWAAQAVELAEAVQTFGHEDSKGEE